MPTFLPWLLLYAFSPAWVQPAPVMRSNKQPASPLTVYVFLATECPLSQNYTLPLNQLQQQYGEKGVVILGVFPADEERQIQDFVRKYQVKFRVMRDRKGKLTRQYHATVTPEAFLINARDQVIYSGKIDDWAIALGKKKAAPTEKYLEEAIQASLAGKTVLTQRTEPVGCLIELPHPNLHQPH